MKSSQLRTAIGFCCVIAVLSGSASGQTAYQYADQIGNPNGYQQTGGAYGSPAYQSFQNQSYADCGSCNDGYDPNSDEALDQFEEEVLENNTRLPLGGFFAPGFRKTVTVLGGWNYPQGDGDALREQLSTPTIDLPSLDEPGYAISFAYGRRHNRKLRSEFEFGFRQNDFEHDHDHNHGFIDGLEVGGHGLSLDSGVPQILDHDHDDEDHHNNQVRVYSLMKNVFFDLDFGQRVIPYIGGGLGTSYVEVETGPTREGGIDDGDTAYSWQGIAGVATPLNADAHLMLEYRYFGTADFDLNGSASDDLSYESSSVFAGIKFEF